MKPDTMLKNMPGAFALTIAQAGVSLIRSSVGHEVEDDPLAFITRRVLETRGAEPGNEHSRLLVLFLGQSMTQL